MFFLSKNSLANLTSRPSLFDHANCKSNDAQQNINDNVSKFKIVDPKPLICVQKIITEIKSQNGEYLVLVLYDGTNNAFGCINKNLQDMSLSYDPLNSKIQKGSVFILSEYSIVNKNENLYKCLKTIANNSITKDFENFIGYSEDEVIVIELEKLSIVGEQYHNSISKALLDKEPKNAISKIETEAKSTISINNIEIADLNNCISKTDWQLKVCLSNISKIREYNNRQTGAKGKTMRLQFYDSTGYVEVVFFNNFCQQFPETYFKINTRYIIRQADVKFSNNSIKSWPNKSGSIYDLHFNKNTEILLDDDQQEIEKTFENDVLEDKENKEVETDLESSVELCKLIKLQANSLIKITAFVTKINKIGFLEKNEKKLELRRIEIIDNTVKKPIKVALWGKQAIECPFVPGHVYQFDDIIITTFGGRSLSVIKKTGIIDVTEMHNLKVVQKLLSWWKTEKNKWFDPNQINEKELEIPEKRKLNDSDNDNDSEKKKLKEKN